MTDHLLVARHGPVLVATLNRPARRNALTLELVSDLHAVFRAALADESLGAFVLTGTPPAFCAGMDLNELLADGGAGHRARAVAGALGELYADLLACAKPVLAAVNGPAVAGGAGLVSVCDVAVAAESARIGYPEIRHGLVAAVVISHLVRCVGPRRARYLLLTGELISGAVAREFGLVDECVPAEQCLPRTIELAKSLADLPRSAYAATKALLASSGAAISAGAATAAGGAPSSATRAATADSPAASVGEDLRYTPETLRVISRFLGRPETPQM